MLWALTSWTKQRNDKQITQKGVPYPNSSGNRLYVRGKHLWRIEIHNFTPKIYVKPLTDKTLHTPVNRKFFVKLRVIPKILFSSHRMECVKRFPVEINEGLNGFEREKIPPKVSHFSLAPRIVDWNLFEFHARLNLPSCVLTRSCSNHSIQIGSAKEQRERGSKSLRISAFNAALNSCFLWSKNSENWAQIRPANLIFRVFEVG